MKIENHLVEQLVIGSLLNNNDLFELVSDILEWNFFSNEYHQIFFKKIKEKIQKGSLANIITLAGYLDKDHISPDYLLAVSKHITLSDNLREYALLVRELFIKREAILLGDLIKEKAKEDNFLEEGILKIEEKLYNLSTQTSHTHSTLSFKDGLEHVTLSIQTALQTEKKIAGLTTGFVDLDTLLGGLHNGHLYILAARPSMGKTALASNIAVNCALDKEYGGPVAFISLEMPYNQIVMRIMSSLTNVPLSNLINTHISKRDFNECINTLKSFHNLPFYIHDTSVISVGEIRTTLRQMKRKWGIKLAIIDYLQLIHSVHNHENRTSEVSRITRNLKAMAKELRIPIIALSQLSRSAESNTSRNQEGQKDHRPQLWHLRESGSIEQDADAVIFIVRQAYYDAKEKEGDYKAPDNGIGLANIYIDKNRNGATGSLKLIYNSFTTTFKNYIQ
jgi:replicative DNA helicase